ncbi:MAG: HD domain-containing protein [Pyrinomonadaceae bacterium]|nr:HD domain-containing protein [Pyrinomonadaceae bacterium]
MSRASFLYQTAVTIVGLGAWAAGFAYLGAFYSPLDQLMLLALTPLLLIASMFAQHFRLPSGLKFTNERLTFTLTDAIVLLVACWYGPGAAIVVGGVEGFFSSRRTVQRLSSNLFSAGMMSLVAAAAAVSLNFVLHYGFNENGAGAEHSFSAVALALLVASVVQIVANILFLSTLLALRHNDSFFNHLKDFLWTTPLFLPTSAVASSLYLALQQGVLVMFLLGAPILLAIYIGHRQYRDSVQKRLSFMEKSHQETIEALAVTINAKDEVTHEHVLRVQIYSAGVARLLGCSGSEIEALRAGALLHDIGKIAVPDYILHKPGKFTADEFEKMKMHTIVGAQILGRVEFPYPVVPIVRSHHERWDGKGYPDGLKGEEIPLTARILSVVDCFDALREDRPYRKGLSREEAIKLIMEGSGTQYDPRVVGTFVTNMPQFEAEIQAHRNAPLPTFGIEPLEELKEAARLVAPAAGLAESTDASAQASFTLRHEELKALYDLSQSLNAARGQSEITHHFTDKLNAVAPFDSCVVTLLKPGAGDAFVAHAEGHHAELLRERETKLGEGVTGWVLANHKPFCNTKPSLDLTTLPAAQAESYRTLAVFPIMRGGEIYGAVSLYSMSLAEYTTEHQRLLTEAASLLAAALASTRHTAQHNPEIETASEDSNQSPAFRHRRIEAGSPSLESELTH